MHSYKKTSWYRKIREYGKALRASRFIQNLPTRKLRKGLISQIQKAQFRHKLYKATPIFVCQMGKVGSRSIVESLEHFYSGVVLHGHLVGKMDWRAQYILKWVKEGRPLRIISPIRDPISRNISAFFHFIEGRIGHASDKSNLPINKLTEVFINNQRSGEDDNNTAMMDHNLPLDWFDDNIKKYFGIDIFSSPFPTCKHTSFSNNNTELLVIRIDLPDNEKEKLIQDFTGLSNFKLTNSNVGSAKGYSEKYREFKNNAKLPDSYLSMMCESKYFKHFYTDKEIYSIKSRWSSNRNN